MSTAVVTIATRSHAHLARTLLASVARCFPEASRHFVVVDRDPKAPEIFAGAGNEIIYGDQLGIPRFSDLAFVNDALAFCCMLKPAAVLHLLARSGVERVIYLDSDMLLLAAPSALFPFLEKHPVALTPHTLSPLPGHAERRDGDIVRSGAFNAGFFAVSRSLEAETFLRWWMDSMLAERRVGPDLSQDQRWLDLGHVYFPFAGVFRDPGYNIAYWNIRQRELTLSDDGRVMIGDLPATLFHFSFFNPDNPKFLANRGPIHVPAESPALQAVVRIYLDHLREAGPPEALPYAYARFTDGTPIRTEQRIYHKLRVWDDPDPVGTPFEPSFRTRNFRGLRTPYTMNKPVAKLARFGLATLRRITGRRV